MASVPNGVETLPE